MDNEVLISKYLDGAMTPKEEEVFANAGHNAAFRDNLAWDQAVHSALSHDAAMLQPIANVPSATLLSKLAASQAAKTFLGITATKLAFLATGVALVGVTGYFVTRTSPQSIAPQVPQIQVAYTPATPMATPDKPVVQHEKAPAILHPKQTVAHEKPRIVLHDEDEKNPPKITNPNYQPPVK